MQTLEHYVQQWVAQGRVPSEQQHRGLVVAHRRARIAPFVIGIGGLLAVAALFALGAQAFRPWPATLGLLGAASLILAGALARAAYLASLTGTLRSRQLGNSGTASWLAAIVTGVAAVVALAAAVTGQEPQVIALAVLAVLGAIAPWFIK